MLRFTVTVDIARRVEDVFAYVTDLSKLPDWQTNTVEVEQLTDGPLGEGTRLREVHGALGRRFEQVVEVVAHEPPRRFALEVVSGPMPVDGRWEFDRIDESGTRVTMTGEGATPGVLRLVAPLLAFAVRRQMTAHHRRLRRILEASTHP